MWDSSPVIRDNTYKTKSIDGIASKTARILTAFVREHSLADGARPHAQAAGELRLWMTGQMLPQGPFVDVMFTADRTRVVRGPPLGYIRISRFSLSWVR